MQIKKIEDGISHSKGRGKFVYVWIRIEWREDE
jgi:hypothetical protein